MNLITKLLMENKTDIFCPGIIIKQTGEEMHHLCITIHIPKELDFDVTKKELLSEVHEKIYVSELEWMLLNHWKDNGADSIIADEDRDISICHGPSDNDFDEFYQNWQKEKLFQFLEKEKEYKLDDLISRCSLIEG